MSEKSNDKNYINSRSEHLRKPTDTVKEIAEQLGIDPDLLTIAFKMHDEGHAYIGTPSALKEETKMKKTEKLENFIKYYEYLVENNFMIQKGISIAGYPEASLLPQYKERITTGMYAEKIPMMTPGIDRFSILEGEYIPMGEQVNAVHEAIDLLKKIKALRKELGIKETPLKGEEEILSAIGHTRESSWNSRRVELSEIYEVAKEGRTGSKEEAMNAVTTSKDEPTIENDGQSHDDE